jgi:hypothetical protein
VCHAEQMHDAEMILLPLGHRCVHAVLCAGRCIRNRPIVEHEGITLHKIICRAHESNELKYERLGPLKSSCAPLSGLGDPVGHKSASLGQTKKRIESPCNHNNSHMMGSFSEKQQRKQSLNLEAYIMDREQ